MSPHRKQLLFLLMLLVAWLGYGVYTFWPFPNEISQTSNSLPLVNVLQEHYQPKLLGDFPQPITVENTEVLLGFPGPNKPATPEEHGNVVLFLNGLCQSNNNTLIERYPFSEASDIYIKVIAKDAKRTEFKFDVVHQGIKTADGEAIIVDKNLMKLIYR